MDTLINNYKIIFFVTYKYLNYSILKYNKNIIHKFISI